MKKISYLILILGLVAWQKGEEPANTITLAPLEVKLQIISDQLNLPTAFAVANDGNKRLFVCEQIGKIRIIANEKLLPEPFLNLSSTVVKRQGYDERGLLGLAFHPDFKKNHQFYVYYSTKTATPGQNHKSVVAEFKVSASNPNEADPNSERILMEFDQPESNHNGGDIKFGADGYLYIATGDGGGAGDKHGEYGNGQNLSNILGKILRIDVNKTEGYGIPADNPFLKTSNAKPEIYAYGLRNPWRFSFDRQTKQLFVGDVGQNIYEEINIVTKGGNYGWRVMEGLHGYRDGKKAEGMIDPIAEYPHTEGISITGGFVYRGKGVASLEGKYVFGDYTGPTWYLSANANGTWERGELKLNNQPERWQIYSFGEDEAGEMYVLANLPDQQDKGIVYKIVK